MRVEYVLLCSMLLCGCDATDIAARSSDPATTPNKPAATATSTPIINPLSGTYDGNATMTDLGGGSTQGPVVVGIAQAGKTLTGTYGLEQAGKEVLLSGTVDGDTVTALTIKFSSLGYPYCDETGTATLSGNVLTGTVAVSASASCTALTTTFSLTLYQ